MQVELFEDCAPITVKFAQFGKPFKMINGGFDDIFIRVKPVNYLLNSTLLNDVINRGKCVVCNIRKGTIFVVEGDRRIVMVDAVIRIKKG